MIEKHCTHLCMKNSEMDRNLTTEIPTNDWFFAKTLHSPPPKE